MENFAGTGAEYTFDLVPGADGLVQVTVPTGVAFAGSNPNKQGLLNRISDTTGPTLIISPNGEERRSLPIPLTFVFSEPVFDFDASDITIDNGTISNFVTGNNIFTANITGAELGTITVSVAAEAGLDAAGNLSEAASATITYTDANELGIPATELAALLAIYSATNGPTDWTDRSGWEGAALGLA